MSHRCPHDPSRRVRTSLALAALVAASSFGARAQVDHQVVYAAEQSGVTGDGSLCNPWTSSSGTGGILEAVSACTTSQLGNYRGCTVVLPRGVVRITATIDTYAGGLRGGLVIRGHGAGDKFDSPANGDAFSGTQLRWWDANPTGCSGSGPFAAANGTVFKVTATSSSRFEDFMIDGGGTNNDGTAGIGLEVTNPSGSNQISIQNIFQNINIKDVDGTPGIGVRVGPPVGTSYQTSEATFSNMQIRNVKTGVLQYGQQTTNIRWRDMTISQFANYGMDFTDGAIQTLNVAFNSSDTSTADVVVRAFAGATDPIPNWAIFENNYHETTHGAAYKFEQGNRRAYPTTFLNTRVLWFQAGGNVIDYQQTGSLSLIGCSFEAFDAPDYGFVYVKTPTGGSTTTIASFGNLWTNNASGGIKLSVDAASISSLVSNDDPTGHFGQLNSVVTQTHKSAGIVYESGSTNWRALGGTSNKFTQYYDTNSDTLRMKNASADIGWWTQGGNLHLDKSTAALEFEGNAGGNTAQLVAADPGAANRVATLPAVTGTVLLSNSSSAQAVCGNVGIDPPSIGGLASGEGTGSFTGLAANDACTCSPRSTWDDDLIFTGCYAAADTLKVRLYHAASGNLNAGSVTVDFCCFRK